MPLVQVLKEHPFAKDMPEPLLKKLAALARQVEFKQDETVFRAGERSMHFCLLLSGSVCVELSAPVFSVHIQTLNAGEAFGWSSLLSLHHTVFQVRAREASTALCLDGNELAKACENDTKLSSEMYRRVAEVVAKRVIATELRLAEFCGSANQHQNGDSESSPDSDLSS